MVGGINLLKTMIKYCSDGIFIADVHYNTIAYSETYRKYLGATKHEMDNNTMLDFYKNGWLSELPLKKVIEERKKYSTIIRYYRTSKEILATGIPVFQNQKIQYIILSFRDMRELNKLEQELNQSFYLIREYQNQLNRLNNPYISNNTLVKYGIVYSSRCMELLLNKIETIADYDSNVLILGETGVGKSILARIVHNLSYRSNQGNFVKIDCSCIPEQLIESELFGYEKGAFTGASNTGKKGLIEQADGGTLFLDEIAELPLHLQSKLLTVIEDKKINRIGGMRPHTIDFRIITATNKDLKQMIEKREFRKDLFYRLNVISLEVPPLKERRNDILPLFKHFEEMFCTKYNSSNKLKEKYYQSIIHHVWEGNVRELMNFAERCALFNEEIIAEEIYTWKRVYNVNDLENDLEYIDHHLRKNVSSLKEYNSSVENNYIRHIIRDSKTLKESAEKLDIDISTLHRKIKKYGIEI